ncbi:MAG TPA: hypothetical protein VH814_10975 [Steroidobacteraceae bacterium]|jgi:hypothetical protein
MRYALLFLFCVVFIELFLLLDPRKEAVAIVRRSHEAARVAAAKGMSDDEKEAFMRRESLAMFKATAMLTLKFLGIFAVLYAIFLGTVAVMPDLERPLLDDFVSPPIIAMMTIATVLYAWARNAILKQL